MKKLTNNLKRHWTSALGLILAVTLMGAATGCPPEPEPQTDLSGVWVYDAPSDVWIYFE